MPERPTWSAYHEQEFPCECCNKFADICECPECPVCTEQGNYKCYAEHGLVNPLGIPIRNIKELCEHVGCHEDEHDDKACESRISRCVYKYTDCGCSFYWKPPMDESYGYVSVSGYCEGSDGHIEPHALAFPFYSNEYNEALEQADKDGVEEWDNTHGCKYCFTGEESTSEEENLYPDEDCPDLWAHGHPIDPDCKACHGNGIII